MMHSRQSIWAGFLTALTLAFAGTTLQADHHKTNVLSGDEREQGWKLLFNGKTTEGWRNYKKDGVSDGWQVVDGVLVRAGREAGDIITVETFGAFELSLEYKISPGGNSGIMFHVTENSSRPWHSGPEIQIQDNEKGHDPQKSGWLYQLYSADHDATHPAGEWNHVRFLLTPERGALWMNGKKYYEFVKGSDEWNALVAKSKFQRQAGFGKATRGHICLQDHGNEVAYRNIKIRSLDGAE